MVNMHIIADQVLSLYNAFVANPEIPAVEAQSLYIAARDRLFAANGITYADYHSWCEDQIDADYDF